MKIDHKSIFISVIIGLFGLISSLSGQEYDITECIEIALDRKGTLVSAKLDVDSANE